MALTLDFNWAPKHMILFLVGGTMEETGRGRCDKRWKRKRRKEGSRERRGFDVATKSSFEFMVRALSGSDRRSSGMAVARRGKKLVLG